MRDKKNQQEKNMGLQKTIICVTNVMKMFEKVYWLIIISLLKEKKNMLTSNQSITD